MKRIPLTELKDLLNLDIDCEMNTAEKYLDVSLVSNWGADTKEDYDKQEDFINTYTDKGKGWILITWCDISGFDYWMIKQEEPNYVQMTINFDNSFVYDNQVQPIKAAIKKAETFFEEKITSFY